VQGNTCRGFESLLLRYRVSSTMKIEINKQEANLMFDIISDVPWEIATEPSFRSECLNLLEKLNPAVPKKKFNDLIKRIKPI
jgi:hypothetical protein